MVWNFDIKEKNIYFNILKIMKNVTIKRIFFFRIKNIKKCKKKKEKIFLWRII